MSRSFLTNINLHGNKLINATIDNTAPSSIVAGSIWYDSTGNTIKVGTGSGTSALLTKSGSIVNADLSGSAGITNANLANSSVTVNGTSISLGSSATIKASTTYALGLTSGGNLAFSSGTTWDGGTTGITIGLSATPTGITSINGISVSGSSGTFLTTASTSSSLTSVGTLTSLTTSGNVTVGGDLVVNGTTTTINSTTISVDDKNIELGSVGTPTNTTADGGGITLKGATDKTFNWVNATSAWTSSEDLNLLTGKVYEINGTTVLSATAIGSGVVGSSLTSVGTITSGTWSGSFGAVSGANLTNLTAGNLSGTIPSSVLGNSTVYIGTTAVALNRATGALTLAGITLTTPVLGVASATSINKVAITAPATSATLTIADGKTLTASNTITFTATDGSTLAIGGGGTLGTAAYTATSAYLAAGVTSLPSVTSVNSTTIPNAVTLLHSTASGVQTFLTTPTSANLRAALSDESGTGALVFAGGDIGAATATTPTTGDNSTKVATTAFVEASINAIGGGVAKYSAANGALTATSGEITWTVTHSLGTGDVIVQVYRQSDKALVDVDVVATDSNTVTLKLISGNLTGSEYRVVVMG